MTVEVKIDPGICNFPVTISATSDDGVHGEAKPNALEHKASWIGKRPGGSILQQMDTPSCFESEFHV